MLKQNQKIYIFLFFSFIFHLMILYFIPSVSILIKTEKEKIIEVSIVKPVPQKIVTPVKKSTEPAQKQISPSELLSQMFNDSGDKKSIIPKVDLPKVETEEKIDLNYELKKSMDKPSDKTGINVEEVINESQINEDKNLAQNKQDKIYESSFFQIESGSWRVRKPTVLPKIPDYSLIASTSVKIRFSVDSRGIPFNVVFLTATDSYIERISSDFVLGLRFEPSGKFDEIDDATITLFYKVR